jgi:hypothetical protein
MMLQYQADNQQNHILCSIIRGLTKATTDYILEQLSENRTLVCPIYTHQPRLVIPEPPQFQPDARAISKTSAPLQLQLKFEMLLSYFISRAKRAAMTR